MNITIRNINQDEIKLLDSFLYEAIYVPKGVKSPSKDIIKTPELEVYIKDFGSKDSDICFVAEVDSKIVGACWTRIMNDYGHVDDMTPSLAISIYKEYRSNGIGKMLLSRMLEELKERGYKQVSLSVQKNNYAVNMYKKFGFEVLKENDEELIMIKRRLNK